MTILGKQFEIFKNEARRCWFLLIMSFLATVLLLFLNLYIGYNIIVLFTGDGWSFLGGLMIATSYILTIPALYFSVKSLGMIRNDSPKKLIFQVILGITGTLTGLLLYNAIYWWIYIVAFSILLLISCLVCEKNKHKISTITNKDIPADKNESPDLSPKKNSSAKNTKTVGIVKTFQIIGLITLFLLTISVFSIQDRENYNIQLIFSIISGALFLLNLIATISFYREKRWALNFMYFESYALLFLTIIFFAIAIISEGVSFTNDFLALVILFTFLILMFGFMVRSYKKLKISNLFLLLFIVAFSNCSSSANKQPEQKKNNIRVIHLLQKNDFNPYIEFYSTDIKDFYHPEEENKYPSTNLFDGFLKTCWIAGSAKKDSTSALYIQIPEQIPVDKLILNIFSGYGKSKALYYKNARPKKIRISVFSALCSDANSTEVADMFFIKKYTESTTINLADTFGIQSFPLKLNADSILQYQQKILKEYHTFSKQQKDNTIILLDDSLTSSIILKLEIEESYKGTKYDDICISEVFFNDRFVSSYPDKYNPIGDVYINNDNTLLADYADKKGVVVLQDTSSIFTMADWPESSNWAILHYVPNDTEGENSRTEEQYLLIDLKNQQSVNHDFKRCTGITLSSPVIDQDENNRLFIDNFDEYKVELK